MQITDYVKPELIVVALVLYFVGMWIKQSEAVKDRYIPLINGGLGIVICGIMCLPQVHAGLGRKFSWQYLPP